MNGPDAVAFEKVGVEFGAEDFVGIQTAFEVGVGLSDVSILGNGVRPIGEIDASLILSHDCILLVSLNCTLNTLQNTETQQQQTI